MAWPIKPKNAVTHNKHCNMSFGRPSKHDLCPRCQELKNGAEPRKGWSDTRRFKEAQFRLSLEKHDCKKSGCGSVCTYGEW